MPVGDGVLDIPTAARRQFGMRKNLPIEVKFSRRVVGDADPYVIFYSTKDSRFRESFAVMEKTYLAALTSSAVS